MNLSHALEIAEQAARAAGDLLRADLHRSGGPRGHVDKAEADTEAEWLIRKRLCEAFPDWGFLGEETGRKDAPEGAPVWLVDPNDGTRDYLLGRRGSAVSIGLIVDAQPVVGVVFAFSYPDDDGDCFAWAEGNGTVRRNGVARSSSPAGPLSAQDVLLVSSGGDRHADGNLECAEPARFRTVPSIAHRLALVGAGEAAVASSVHSPGAWDYAGGHALLRGADAQLVNEMGLPISYGADGASRAQRAFGGSESRLWDLHRRPWEGTRDGELEPSSPIRLEPGRLITSPALLGRAQGCLLGQLIGESWGRMDAPSTSQSGSEATPSLVDHSLLAGQPSEYSEWALALGRRLLEANVEKGSLAATVRREEPEWMHADIESGLFSVLTPFALHGQTRPVTDVAAEVRGEAAAFGASSMSAAVAGAYVAALSRVVAGESARDAHQAARASLESPAQQSTLDSAIVAGSEDATPMSLLGTALHALMQPTRMDRVLPSINNQNRGAAVGAFLGARDGRAAVPEQWRVMVLSCRPHARRTKHPRPRAYWPVDILELAERLLLAGQISKR